MDLSTNTHSQYLQKNVSLKAHKHIHPGHYDQQNSKPGKCRRPVSESSIRPQNRQVHHSPGSTPNWNHINLVTMTSKVHSSKVHRTFYRRCKTTQTIRKSIPEGEDQARFSCRQLDRAGNPVVSPSRARASTLSHSVLQFRIISTLAKRLITLFV